MPGFFCRRAEDFKERFPLVLSQASMPLAEMLKLLKKVLSSEGEAFLFKSPSWKKDGPKIKGFTAEVFKSYKTDRSKKLILRLKPV